MNNDRLIPEERKSPYRRVTVALVEKNSSVIIRYSVLEAADSPYNLVEHYLEGFADEMVGEMNAGEERAYSLFERIEGLRPSVKDIRISNKPKTIRWEKSVMGQRGPGATGSSTTPYSIDIGERTIVKRGAFPRLGEDHSGLLDDDGLDEKAIQTALQQTQSLLRTALADNFAESSQNALLAGLGALIRSTGGVDGPRDDWYSDPTDETAVNLFDAAILLWSRNDAANTLPAHMKEGCFERLAEDPDRAEQIQHIAAIIEKHGLI